MADHVRFVDRFVGRVELTRWLEAADVFVTPYPKLDQIVSGTLSYAMGAGRAIVSTPYAYATEVLANGRGILVPPDPQPRWADALNQVLGDDGFAPPSGGVPMRTVGGWCGRPSAPSTVACSDRWDRRSRMRSRLGSWPRSMPDLAPLHPVSRAHLDALTGDLGIMQHAVGADPDPAHGYCTDDVARALQVDLLHQRELGWDAVAASAWPGMRFLDEAFDHATGRFRNFRRCRRVVAGWDRVRGQSGSGDARARLDDRGSPGSLPWSRPLPRLFLQALPATQGLRALRAQSSVLLGCEAVMRSAPTITSRARLPPDGEPARIDLPGSRDVDVGVAVA